MMTYLFLILIANKTLELVYENAPKCTILKRKNQNFSAEGHCRSIVPSLDPSPGREGYTPSLNPTLSAPSSPRFSRFGARPRTAFLTNRTLHRCAYGLQVFLRSVYCTGTGVFIVQVGWE